MSASEPLSCPKCGLPRERAEAHGACPGCGLRLALWPGFHAGPAPHPALDEGFSALRARWDEPAAHDSFLALARAQGALDGAAARYREYLRTAPDDAAARRGLEQAALLAVHQQDASPHEAPRGVKLVQVALIVVLLVLAVGLGMAVHRLFPLLGH